MAKNWFDYGIVGLSPTSDGHQTKSGGRVDDGVDLATPNNTPVNIPFAGTVIDASYHDYGGQVVVEVPGTGASEYAIHLNQISSAVKPGAQVFAGQYIGTSGGGVGDLVLHDGQVQPAQSQSWYDGHSTGYHSEFGIFKGTTMGDFNRGWGASGFNAGRQIDPAGVVNALAATGKATWPGISGIQGDKGSGSNDPSTTPSPGSLQPPGGTLCSSLPPTIAFALCGFGVPAATAAGTIASDVPGVAPCAPWDFQCVMRDLLTTIGPLVQKLLLFGVGALLFLLGFYLLASKAGEGVMSGVVGAIPTGMGESGKGTGESSSGSEGGAGASPAPLEGSEGSSPATSSGKSQAPTPAGHAGKQQQKQQQKAEKTQKVQQVAKVAELAA